MKLAATTFAEAEVPVIDTPAEVLNPITLAEPVAVPPIVYLPALSTSTPYRFAPFVPRGPDPELVARASQPSADSRWIRGPAREPDDIQPLDRASVRSCGQRQAVACYVDRAADELNHRGTELEADRLRPLMTTRWVIAGSGEYWGDTGTAWEGRR